MRGLARSLHELVTVHLVSGLQQHITPYKALHVRYMACSTFHPARLSTSVSSRATYVSLFFYILTGWGEKRHNDKSSQSCTTHGQATILLCASTLPHAPVYARGRDAPPSGQLPSTLIGRIGQCYTYIMHCFAVTQRVLVGHGLVRLLLLIGQTPPLLKRMTGRQRQKVF